MNTNIQPLQFAEWFAKNRHTLSHNGLPLDGGEPGRRDPADFGTCGVRILFCRLSTYDAVAPSITHRLLYWAANRVKDVYADLAFLPAAADAAILERDGIPWWLANGCKQSPRDFDIIAISLSVPQEAVNLPAALAHSGLELTAAARRATPGHPLIVLGGNSANAVPFLHGDAGDAAGSGGLVDVVCNGDGLGWLQEFLPAFAKAKKKRGGFDRQAFLLAAARKIVGTYVPEFYRHHTDLGRLTEIVPAEEDVPLPVPYRSEPPDLWLEEYDGAYIPFADQDAEETLPLSVGCRFRCRFCQTGWGRGVPVDSPAGALVEAAHRLKINTAAEDLNLLASDACSVPEMAAAIRGLLPLFRHVSVKSLSVAGLARDPEGRELVKNLDKREFSLGVEGISHRLRAHLGKQADAATLEETVRALAFGGGLRQLKLFFIMTGRETKADAEELFRLMRRIREASPGGRIVASFTPLFLAPFTPLQFAAVHRIEPSVLEEIEKAVKNAHGEFRWSTAPGEIRFMTHLSRAGRAATRTLVRISVEKKLRYYDSFSLSAIAECEREFKLDFPALNQLDAAIPEGGVLPWDDCDCGTARHLLLRAYKQAEANVLNPPAVETRLAPPPARRLPPPPALADAETAPLTFWTWLPVADAPRPGTTLARGLLRDWFATCPEAADAYHGDAALLRLPGFAGWTLLRASFSAKDTQLPFGGLLTKTPSPERRAVIAGPLAPEELPALETLVYHVVLPAAESAAAITGLETALKTQKVHFQAMHRPSGFWRVVGKNFRRRAGLYAAWTDTAGVLHLLCTERVFELLGGDAARLLRTPLATAVLIQDGKCPKCGGERLRAIRGTVTVTCPDCAE